MSPPPLTILQDAVDRWLLLHRAEASAEAVPGSRRERVVLLHKAGAARLDAAMGEAGIAALILAREAVSFFLNAAVTARGSDAPPARAGQEQLWRLYDDIAEVGFVPSIPPSLQDARLRASAEQAPDREIAEFGEPRIAEAISLATFLAGAVERRTPAQVRIARNARKLVLAALVIGPFLYEVDHRFFRSKNLALNAPVVASSKRPGSGPPQGLSNGVVEPALAFATKDEPDSWVSIDLGPVQRVSEVTLVNSDDHPDDALPIRVETSADGVSWEAAGSVTAHFRPESPAVLTFATRDARIVRVHGRPSGALYLNEVEVR